MTDYSRPATLDDLKKLAAALNAAGVDYLLIGGYALFAHGYHRATTDIDLLVPSGREPGERLRAALMVLPDGVAAELDPAWFEQGENIRVADEIVVDVLFNAGGETYASLLPFAETLDVDDIPIRTLNLEGLLRTKQGVRDKDAMDRRVIEQALALLRSKR